MSGEVNASLILMRLQHPTAGWLSIGGQVSHTSTANRTPVDVSNKITSPNERELLASQGDKFIDYSLECNYNSETAYNYIRELADNGDLVTVQVINGADDIATAVVFHEHEIVIESVADNAPGKSAFMSTITLKSSGSFMFDANYTYEALTDSAGDPITDSSGAQIYTREAA